MAVATKAEPNAPSLGAAHVAALLRGDDPPPHPQSTESIGKALGFIMDIHRPYPYPVTKKEKEDDFFCGRHCAGFALRNTAEDGEWIDLGSVPVLGLDESFSGIAEGLSVDGYVTLNGVMAKTPHHDRNLREQGYLRPARRVGLVTRLCALSVDFDLYNVPGQDVHQVQATVNEWAESMGMPVSMWVRSKGLRALWLLREEDSDSPPKARDSAVRLWGQCVAAICNQVDGHAELRGVLPLGIDRNASMNAVGTIRIPGTTSTKDFRRVSHTVNKDGGGALLYELADLASMLGVRAPKKRTRKGNRPKVQVGSLEMARHKQAGSHVRYLREMKRTQALFEMREPGSIQEGGRHFAVLTFALVLSRASLAASQVLKLGLEDYPHVEALYSVYELESMVLDPAALEAETAAFATLNCSPGDFDPMAEATGAAAEAAKRKPADHLRSDLIASRFQVTAEEAEALRFGGAPWPVAGVDTRSARAKAKAYRLAMIARLIQACGRVPSLRQIQSALEAEDGSQPSTQTIRRDLADLGLS